MQTFVKLFIVGALGWGLWSGANVAVAAPVNPVVHYGFETAGAGLFNDTSGNGYNGTVASTGTQVGGAPFGSGLTVNGTSNFVQMPATLTDSLFSTDAATMSMWVRLNVATTNGSLANFGISNSHYPWADGNGYFGEFRTTRVDGVPLSGSVDRTQWHHLAIVNDPTASQWRLYQNGVLQFTTASEAWTLQNNGAGTGRIAFNNAANYISGAIDEFYLFNEALTAAQINNLRLYNSTDEPPPPLAPEPASVVLFGLALVGGGVACWRRRNRS